jgi:golgin subfamily A member 4
MDEIDTLFNEMITKRSEQRTDITEQVSTLQKDPTAAFNLSYVESIHQLSAKDGLGKTFGQPRRLA